MKRITLTPGQRFGRLTVLSDQPSRSPNGRNLVWHCRCDCGETTRVHSVSLRTGRTASCGCLLREVKAALHTTHGLSHTAEYEIWKSMRARCQRASHVGYSNYGGRGITVCAEWQDFAAFYRDMGPRPSPAHTLDRIDNDGPYSPENCRWATKAEQAANRRATVMLSHNGETLPISEWARRLGFHRNLIPRRLKMGWTIERSLTEPPGPPRN